MSNIKGINFSFSSSRSSYRRVALQLSKAPSCLYINGRLGPQASKASRRATRVGKHNNLLLTTDQPEHHCRGVETRTEAEGRRPGPAGGSLETPAAAAGESNTQWMQ